MKLSVMFFLGIVLSLSGCARYSVDRDSPWAQPVSALSETTVNNQTTVYRSMEMFVKTDWMKAWWYAKEYGSDDARHQALIDRLIDGGRSGSRANVHDREKMAEFVIALVWLPGMASGDLPLEEVGYFMQRGAEAWTSYGTDNYIMGYDGPLEAAAAKYHRFLRSGVDKSPQGIFSEPAWREALKKVAESPEHVDYELAKGVRTILVDAQANEKELGVTSALALALSRPWVKNLYQYKVVFPDAFEIAYFAKHKKKPL